ncbi:hypothetical protein PGUG_01347 [Meyerozyma guilliermondii ATCC 6260]|uniref:Uncharacterized protein n=1 Tax=Meyerozyma guilliermondii (strain ATCC 6260 / CBS 566 / DSM 6381 / JCM 1539 / NBRC 10279 / NRRL Y-324) TaxID=294746 RepID=A5DDJ6_PICGU|nr:uncharacterized protein PGUG_01347 [Meyerozyma guilliermondii ATCC 6260]EDK37249.1 hypothetical protein PGUG_01347 [Meyerozyma guilliermondii ATCC 6260]
MAKSKRPSQRHLLVRNASRTDAGVGYSIKARSSGPRSVFRPKRCPTFSATSTRTSTSISPCWWCTPTTWISGVCSLQCSVFLGSNWTTSLATAITASYASSTIKSQFAASKRFSKLIDILFKTAITHFSISPTFPRPKSIFKLTPHHLTTGSC